MTVDDMALQGLFQKIGWPGQPSNLYKGIRPGPPWATSQFEGDAPRPPHWTRCPVQDSAGYCCVLAAAPVSLTVL
jgi:hypothetical protein